MANTKLSENVQVVVRCRPMNLKEMKSGFQNVVDVLQSVNAIRIFNPKETDFGSKNFTFTFDATYNCDTKQEYLYKKSVQPVINSVLNGFNGTIFAYGQTGTGKTFTMEGNHLDPNQKGVIPRTFEQIFNHISQSKNTQYLVRASYIEIYQEEVKDLLEEGEQKYHELSGDRSGMYISNLKSYVCKSVNEMLNVMRRGKQNRKVGSTDMNEHSSRSHAIFIITIEMSNTILGVNHVKVGKLNLVDLAGSERQSKSCTSGQRLKEATKINLSLSALGNVISALSNGKNFHVPYRDSKLTRLLQDSLGGNSKTLMIANIGPANYNYDEILTTLRYANRAKNIKNKPVVNQDPKDALIREYQDEIIRLKALLQSTSNTKPKVPVSANNTTNNRNQMENNFTNDIIEENQFLRKINSFTDDEKIKLAQDETKKQQQSLIEETTQTIESLRLRIHSMESRLLQGTNIADHTHIQQKVLQQQAEEIEERTRRKLELEQQLEKEEETTEELQDSHINLQQDIARKLRKSTKVYSKIQMIKNQTAKMIEDFNNDRNKLQLAQNELIKEYKLNQIIVENFILESNRREGMAKVYYNEEKERWEMNLSESPSIPRTFATPHQRRPESENSRLLAKLNYSMRYKGENIINLDLDQYRPSTSKIPIVQHALEKALKSEDDIIVDASSSKGNNFLRNERKTSDQSIGESSISTSQVYPKVRGLVKKK